MTYFGFLIRFIGIPLAAIVLLSLRDRWRGLGLPPALIGPSTVLRPGPILLMHVVAAVVWTTPWDNYLVATGVWFFDPARVTGVALGLLPPLIYLSAADAVAIRAGTWTIAPSQTTGILIAGLLPLEELVFFALTNVLIVFGMVLMLGYRGQPGHPGMAGLAGPGAVDAARSRASVDSANDSARSISWPTAADNANARREQLTRNRKPRYNRDRCSLHLFPTPRPARQDFTSSLGAL